MRRPLCCSRRFLNTMISIRRRHVIVIIASGPHWRGVEAANQDTGNTWSPYSLQAFFKWFSETKTFSKYTYVTFASHGKNRNCDATRHPENYRSQKHLHWKPEARFSNWCLPDCSLPRNDVTTTTEDVSVKEIFRFQFWRSKVSRCL